MERVAHFQSFILHTSRIPRQTKSPDTARSHRSLGVPGKWASPSWSPKKPLWGKNPVSRAFQNTSFRVPSKRNPPPYSFPSQSSHRKRHSVSASLLLPSLKVPAKWAPLQGPQRDRYGEISVSRAFQHTSFRVCTKGAPPHSPGWQFAARLRNDVLCRQDLFACPEAFSQWAAIVAI